MRAFISCLIFLFVTVTVTVSINAQSSSGGELAVQNEAVIYVTGSTLRVDGEWVERDFYVVDGMIKWSAERNATDTLYVQNKFITPGFADAHTHNLDRAWQRGFVDRYISEGTLVVQNLTSKSKGVDTFRDYLETTASPYVRYSNWGFTSTLGHPFMAYEPYAMGLNNMSTWSNMADSISQSRLDLYNSYAFVDSVEQLETIWPEFLQTNPDVVKIYYFNEGAIEDREPGSYGLRLEVAEAIIDSAKTAGLRVFVHIETRDEFEAMVDAGVDAIAHMPGYGWGGDAKTYDDVYLPDVLLRRAADSKVVIIPTAVLNQFIHQNDQAGLNATITLQNDLIRRYRSMGGIIAPGSDVFSQTGEILYKYYAEHIKMPAGEMLDMFTAEATAIILPGENTGRIADGYRADFLIFDEKPFESGSWEKPVFVYLGGQLVADNTSNKENQ